MVAQLARLIAAAQLRSPVGFRLAEHTTPGEEQRVALLSRQPLRGRQLIGEFKQPLFALVCRQIVLFEQRENQRLIAQRTAIVGEPVVGFASGRKTADQRLFGTRFITHFFQRYRQLHQRQTRARIGAPIKQTAQSAQRCLLATRQHQTCVCLHGKAGVFGIFAVIDVDQIALLHVTQQPFIGFFQSLRRHGKSLFASPQEEIGDVRGQPVFLFAISAP